ncbi:SNF2-related protein [Limnohabitans sp. DM1]|uniref:SNF2-related protein n=1 Tax=Limnohabitans sp. DM1 TaxID=1597955 RepID=UPI000A95075C|nr:SNF2-related protein [Limnohabitans sp. DM1]
MSLFKLFNKTRPATEKQGWRKRDTDTGIELRSGSGDGELLRVDGLSGALCQLHDDGLAVAHEGGYFLPWDYFFEACALPAYEGLSAALGLPKQTVLRPALSSRGAIVDEDFAISLGPWLDPAGQQLSPEYQGALLIVGGQTELMRHAHWTLFQSIRAFAQRTPDRRTEHEQRHAWGRIRQQAISANAALNDFLMKTIVLSPDRLDLGFRKSEAVTDDTVIEVIPGFAGAPADWLVQFDRFEHVANRYDLPGQDGGLIQIVISPDVRTVLEQVKRMPGRRIAGSRAQAFLLNPFSALGEVASEVINEAQFEQAKVDAGIFFERFTPVIERDPMGFPTKVGLRIESADEAGLSQSEILDLSDAELSHFVDRLDQALRRGLQLVFWEGHDLEVLPEAQLHLKSLQQALEQKRMPRVLVSYEQVHDISAYSPRIEGVGIEKTYYSPYIAKKKDDEGWFPENVIPLITYTPEGSDEAIAVPVPGDALNTLQAAAEAAAQRGETEFSLPWLPQPMTVEEAQHIVGAINTVTDQITEGEFRPPRPPKDGPKTRKTLMLRPNIDSVDYQEHREKALRVKQRELRIPRSLSPLAELMPHQRDGVGRLQYLFELRSGFNVRGMVLADDMGLGKTLQLLTLMASMLEEKANPKPILVVAPVSLLENWKEEAEKFYPGTFKILTAYGDTLAKLRVPRENIDIRLRTDDALLRFLKPGWVGDAQLVLTTYETLRDLEFSFAAEQWSLMVCDEAQRIKNPASMVTRAAKKQNAEFKIACTGTPVENTLADLWCLFDYVQPGLLGALNEFGRMYRRPIEIDDRDETAKQRIEELRIRIEPQILRRTKLEVAAGLKLKIVDQDCRRLTLSTTQRQLYVRAIEDFKNRDEPGSHTPFKNHLGLLHYLRLICTDPRRHGLSVFTSEPLDQYRKAAPKLDWLIRQLRKIEAQGEKAIVFCEFRNIQTLLQHYIAEVFGFQADIINGDTTASHTSTTSRQKRIKAFQAGQGFGVIILSPIAVGFGVNIQAANHVIHYTRTWNPAKEDQATDRAWRIGQKKDVFVYYPVVAADDFTTFDVKLDQLLERKRSLAGDMLNGSPDINTTEFALPDIVPTGMAQGIDEVVTLDIAMRMDWRYFEALAAAIWSRLGYGFVYCTPASNDHGVDVVAIRGDRGVLIQTKTSATDGLRLGWNAVRDVVAGEAFYEQKHPGVTFDKVGLTNQYFNPGALAQAELNNVELIDRTKLAQLLSQFRVSMLEVERLLFQ